MDEQELRCAMWRTSGHCDGGSCVEVAQSTLGMIAVRDNLSPNSPFLLFAPAGWTKFLDEAKRNIYDLHISTGLA